MGWASAGYIFDTVASALVEAKADYATKYTTCKRLLVMLTQEGWDTVDDRIDNWRDEPAIMLAFREQGHGVETVKATLFKPDGKYYTDEEWATPEGAIGPYDMDKSPDFRRIGGGSVLIEAQEPWGFPHLFPGASDDNR